MSNKILRKLSLFILAIVALFSFNVSLKAVQTGAVYPQLYPNLNFYMNKIGSHNLNTGIYKTDGYHAYCIEPGVPINGTAGYDTNLSSGLSNYDAGYFTTNTSSKYYVGNNDERKKMVSQILTFAINLGPVTSNKNYFTSQNRSAAYKTFAAQGLIWEVITGERKTFNNLWPENHSGTNCSFYDVVHMRNNCNNEYDLTGMKQEYDRLVNSIQGSFNVFNTGNLGSNGNYFKPTKLYAQQVALSWNGSKYSLTINDTNFKYWTVASKDEGLEVTKNDSSITISSNKPISKADSKTVEIKVYNKDDSYRTYTGTNIYIDSNLQDVVAIGGTTLSSYIKVYTPNYQLKVIKKASLDGKLLSGAKFNICSDSKCLNILETITTDKTGIATFEKIPSPGIYYIKEIEAPEGYELNSTPRAITVSSSNISGSSSYAIISITDTNKVFNLTKKTIDEDGNDIDLDDGCGSDIYTGPEFEIKENGNSLYFKEIKPGEYDFSNKDTEGATTKLKTCNGKFKVYTLPRCNYTISETKAPEGLTLPTEPSKTIDVCGSDKNVSFTNGFAGLEFQKKDEDGTFVKGGKFSLQKKINNVYRDILLKQNNVGNYIYDSNLTEEDENATYMILTNEGIARITKLPPGEYRIVEKEAPEGYELIEDKDSKALVTIKDSDKDGYYLVEMIDQKVNKNGSKSSAELVVTITTGRKVINYILIISALSVLLIIAIILRKKVKK